MHTSKCSKGRGDSLFGGDEARMSSICNAALWALPQFLHSSILAERWQSQLRHVCFVGELFILF